jgi:AAA15 family ATPase/GTPase
MQLEKITISNYRSINKIVLNVDKKQNLISFAGANNVGKTNIINALALFFEKIDYDQEKDCPYHKFYGTRGGHYRPKIQLVFSDGKDMFDITKDWNISNDGIDIFKIVGKKNKKEIQEKDILKFLKTINFFFLPSINISFPEAIKYIMNSDVIDIETGNSRLSGKKGEMKKSIELKGTSFFRQLF